MIKRFFFFPIVVAFQVWAWEAIGAEAEAEQRLLGEMREETVEKLVQPLHWSHAPDEWYENATCGVLWICVLLLGALIWWH